MASHSRWPQDPYQTQVVVPPADPRQNDATARGTNASVTTPTGATAVPAPKRTGTAAPPSTEWVDKTPYNQEPSQGPRSEPGALPRGGDDGGPYTPPVGGGAGPNPQPGGDTGNTGWGTTSPYQSPTGGLVGYYGDKMGSQGMGNAEWNALTSSTMIPAQVQAQQARDAMLRARAATGNDTGLYAGLSEVAVNASKAQGDQARQNILTNEEIRRREQAEGAAGNLNLYGQTQAETMEYLRMLGNLLGRQDAVRTSGSGSSAEVGIAWNPGGSQGSSGSM